ncbi:nuclear distribution protein nudE-like 1-B isoform X2 [Onthophagus taurus]|uniref:nuclear distribution protein nudE-like 1-B isoform X2 n=1 Tax=Onthophagus taurus TaxID=166361 RepID=UPI0039BE58DF
MDRGDRPNFNTIEEELAYWKNLCSKFMQERDTVQNEFDDYVAESQQLEKEYEVTIEQNEKKIRQLMSTNNLNQNEIDSLKLKLDTINKERDNLEDDLLNLKKEQVDFQRKIRDLEQKNDDLEQSHRMITESINAVESVLNSAIERNAMLESEIDEKETLKEKIQRLTDETRELKQELQVRETIPDNERMMNGHVDSNRLTVEHETQTTPIKREANVIDASLSPSSRILALNIVGDIIRKVGKLEAELGQCRHGYNRDFADLRRSKLTGRGRFSPSTK